MAVNQSSRESRSDVERTRGRVADALPGLAVLALAAVAMFVFDVPGPNAGTGVWAVLMLAATGLFMWAEVRSLQRADEYQRLLQLQALAVGFAVVVVLLQVASVLVAAQLMDARQGLQMSFIGGLVAWLGVRALQARKA
jgi:hypothetical protein